MGKGTKILGEKIKIMKNWGGEENQVVGNFIHSFRKARNYFAKIVNDQLVLKLF